MSRDDTSERPRVRWGSAVLMGTATGFAAAAVGTALWTWIGKGARELPPPHEIARVDLFRLPSGGPREALLVPAGPDATGEERLAGRLYPGKPRELVSLVLANVSPDQAWDVDLAAEPLRCRAGDGAWEDVARVEGALSAADELRVRGLGGGEVRVSIPPGALRQVLLALPPGRKLCDLTDVQWGSRPLTRDTMDVGRIRRFREDPAGTGEPR